MPATTKKNRTKWACKKCSDPPRMFSHSSDCRRHIVTYHFGFSYKCSGCGKTMARKPLSFWDTLDITLDDMEGRITPLIENESTEIQTPPGTIDTPHKNNNANIPENEEQSKLNPDICKAIEDMRPQINLLQSWQDDKITLCVGGKCFDTTKSTLMQEPTSLISVPCGLYSIYKDPKIIIDRDPSHFKFILNYLRYGCKMPIGCLPNNTQVLHELKEEAKFYVLPNLVKVIEEKLESTQK